VIHTDNKDGCVVLGRSRDDGLLGTTLQVFSSCLLVAEDTSALSDVVGTDTSPRDLRGVGLLEHIDLVSIDFDSSIDLLDGSLKLAVN